MKIILAFLPIFIVVIWYDWYWGTKNKKNWSKELYKKNVFFGAAAFLAQQVYKPVFLLAYNYIVKNFGLFDLGSQSWVVILLGFLISDLAFYFWHRFSHTNALLWGGHAIHHTSGEFNMGLTFRLSMIGPIFMLGFHLPMAILGIPTEVFSASILISTLWQIWLHTEAIKRIPILEDYFVTPATHALHHATNTIYRGKNFGATLVIWDRLFGTHQFPTETPVYQMKEDITHYGLIQSNIFFYRKIFSASFKKSHLDYKV